MSQYCPLCGNKRSDDSVFCDECKKKIEKEYEVDIPERKAEQQANNIQEQPDLSPQSENESQDDASIEKRDASASDIEPGHKNTQDEKTEETENETLIQPQKAVRKKFPRFLWVALIIFLAVSGFFYYGNTIRQNNLEKLQWDAALKDNSVSGYIEYMIKFPKGKNYDLAEQNIRILKDGESTTWEELQHTQNSAKLRDFINVNSNSSIAPLVKKRLDSLEWISALSDNSAESYSKYKEMVKRGDFSGDYIIDAEKRFGMLSQKYPVDQNILDSLKVLTDGFFTALSTLNAEKLETYLASRVFRFFGPGGGTKEKIIGELLISGSKTQAPTIDFIPNLSGLTYEKTQIEHYLVNLPVQKSYINSDGKKEISTGYIIQMEINSDFQIATITEDEPRRR